MRAITAVEELQLPGVAERVTSGSAGSTNPDTRKIEMRVRYYKSLAFRKAATTRLYCRATETPRLSALSSSPPFDERSRRVPPSSFGRGGLSLRRETDRPIEPNRDPHARGALRHAKALGSYIRKLGPVNQYHRCALRNASHRCPRTHSRPPPPVASAKLVPLDLGTARPTSTASSSPPLPSPLPLNSPSKARYTPRHNHSSNNH